MQENAMGTMHVSTMWVTHWILLPPDLAATRWVHFARVSSALKAPPAATTCSWIMQRSGIVGTLVMQMWQPSRGRTAYCSHRSCQNEGGVGTLGEVARVAMFWAGSM